MAEETIQGGTMEDYAKYAKSLAVDIPEITWKDVGNVALDFTPIIGDIKGGYETVQMIGDELAKDNPNYKLIGILGGMGAAATIIGLVPGAGDVAKKTIMSGARSVAEGANKFVNAMPAYDPSTLGSFGGNIFAGKAGSTDLLGNPIGSISQLYTNRVPGADPRFGPTGRISTRVPTQGTEKTGGVFPTEEVYSGELVIDKAAMNLGDTTSKNMEVLSSKRKNPEIKNPYVDNESYFPGFAGIQGLPPEDAAEFVSAMQKENLNWVMDKLPKDFQNRAKLWYVGANRFSEELSIKYGVPRSSMSGVVAALSPQMDWFKNASLAERVADAVINNRNFPWSSEMTSVAKKYPAFTDKNNAKVWESIKGKSYSDLETTKQKAMWIRAYDESHNPKTYRALTPEGDLGDIVLNADGNPAKIGWGQFGEIEKAVKAIESNGDFKIISDAMGSQHKVRNFFNNIEVPFSDMGDVTIDTHAIAAGLMRPLSGADQLTTQGLGMTGGASKATGTKGMYGLTADDYRSVAAERGLLPRETQSIVWEGIRGLFNNKSLDNKIKINAIWTAVDRGDLTQKQALDLIEEASGGFSSTSWINEPRPKRSIAGGGTTMFGVPIAGAATLGALPSEKETSSEMDM